MPSNTFPVDCYGRISCIRNGQVATVRGADGGKLRVGALWGVENADKVSPRSIKHEAANALAGKGQWGFDLLLTHDVPFHSFTACTGHSGSTIISDVLRKCAPPLHLFGHAHPVDARHEFHAEPIPTRSWIFEDAGFGKKCNGNLEGAMGVLTWGTADTPSGWSVEMVTDAWLKKMRHRSWHHVWPNKTARTGGGHASPTTPEAEGA